MQIYWFVGQFALIKAINYDDQDLQSIIICVKSNSPIIMDLQKPKSLPIFWKWGTSTQYMKLFGHFKLKF